MMTKSDLKNRLERLAGEYSLKVSELPNGYELELEGGSETFEVWDEDGEFILLADNWHQHFDSLEALDDLLTALFKGQAWVVLKQTGHLLDGYRLVKQEAEGEAILRETGMANPPSMRPKRFVRIGYENGVRSSGRVEA